MRKVLSFLLAQKSKYCTLYDTSHGARERHGLHCVCATLSIKDSYSCLSWTCLERLQHCAGLTALTSFWEVARTTLHNLGKADPAELLQFAREWSCCALQQCC